MHNPAALLFNLKPSEQHAALKYAWHKEPFLFHLSESALLSFKSKRGKEKTGTCIRHTVSSQMCLSLLLLQLLQVFSYLGCLGQRGRIQPVISTAAAAAASATSSLIEHSLLKYVSHAFLVCFSEKQLRGEACRSVWNVGEGIRRRPLHFPQLPKQVPPRHRVCLHP